MKAPNKIYVEVCEDGIFAFPEPPFKESVEYIRTDLVEGIKGNSEGIPSNVDLEKEIQRYLCEECSSDDEPTIKEIAHHFYKLGLKAKRGG